MKVQVSIDLYEQAKILFPSVDIELNLRLMPCSWLLILDDESNRQLSDISLSTPET